MIVEFDIPKRLYDDLKSWCEANDIEINKYVSLKIRGALTLDKFGDLNEKVKKKQKEEGKKRPVLVDVEKSFSMDEIKYCKYVIDFK
jgi:ribosome maturation factor RimP